MSIGSKYKNCILNIKSDAEGGTAFLIAPKVALTVAHTIDDDKKITLTLGTRKISAKTKKYDRLDIAILFLDEECSEYLDLYDIEINEGDNWMTFGYPNFDRKNGEPLDDEKNKVSLVFDLEEGKKHDIKLKYNDIIKDFSGFSGSPLIINDKVVGILNTEIPQRGDAIRLTALSVKNFREFVEKIGIEVFENNKIENDFQELEVIKVDLRVTFSSISHMTSLLFQPRIQLEEAEFNRLIIKDKEQHSKKVSYLLNLAKDNTRNALAKDVNFILMPEYSIHGTIGIGEIIKELTDSNIDEQIVIGGIEGLTKKDFITLLCDSSFEKPLKEKMKNWANRQPEGRWFNTAIIIEKFKDDIKYYLQPRILCSPAEETLVNMVEGKWVVLFSTHNAQKPLHFFNLISYDWVGSINGEKILNTVAKRIKGKKYNIGSGQHCIAFIPKFNPYSDDNEFKSSIKEFLCNCSDWCDVHGRNAIAFILNAALNKGEFGETSIVINNGKYNCRENVLPTYSVVSRKELDEYTDVRFRKKRECIHAVELSLPFSVNDCANNDRYPCIQAIVHTINGQPVINDPRYPDPPGAVCGYTKVLNDFIDIIKEKDHLKIELQTTFLEKLYNEVLEEKCCSYRNANKAEIIKIFDNFFNYTNYEEYRKHKGNCDYWSVEIEGDAFGKFISFMCVLELAKFNIQKSELFHARLTVSSLYYNLLIVYIKESDEIEIVRSFRELFDQREDSGDSERLFIVVVGKISNRALGKITTYCKNSYGSLFTGDVFCKLDRLFEDITEKADELDEIAKLQSLVEQTFGGRG